VVQINIIRPTLVRMNSVNPCALLHTHRCPCCGCCVAGRVLDYTPGEPLHSFLATNNCSLNRLCIRTCRNELLNLWRSDSYNYTHNKTQPWQYNANNYVHYLHANSCQ